MSNLEKINIIVGWYKGLSKGFNDVDTLIYSRRKLATHLFELADYVGNLRGLHNEAHFLRKSAQATAKVDYLSAGESASSSTILTDKDTFEAQSTEHAAESKHMRIKLLYESGKDILSSMVQDIAYLRHEKINSNE